MRILQITTILRYGSGIVTTELATRLSSRGHEVHVVSATIPELPAWPSLIEQLASAEVRHHEINTFKRDPSNLWKAGRQLLALLERESFDIIHAHSGTPCYLAWLASKWCSKISPPIVGTLHGFTSNQRPYWIDAMDRFSWSRCDLRIAVSKECANLAKQKGIVCKRWVRPGLTKPFADYSENDAPSSKNDRFTIVNVGEVEPRKGQLDLVLAAAEASKSLNIPISCILVGGTTDKTYLQKIKEAAAQSPLLTASLTGETTDPIYYLKQADACVYPSQSEGLGLSIVEAIACERPTYFSYSSGCKDIADTLGLHHTTFASGDVRAISQSLVNSFRNPPNPSELRSAASRAKQAFSFESFCDQYLEHYRSLLSR